MIDGQTDQQKCLVNSELVIEKAIVDYFFSFYCSICHFIQHSE